jgi:hypothetical protein
MVVRNPHPREVLFDPMSALGWRDVLHDVAGRRPIFRKNTPLVRVMRILPSHDDAMTHESTIGALT